ncbi:MAG: hypothetical protein FJ240_08780 [Nitrospira sp.]|nr:hypothetical protein [Nitrospira sp.]
MKNSISLALLIFVTLSVFGAVSQKQALSAAGPAFSINRTALYFENRRPDITVQRNQPIKVFADIKYTGSGLLQGYWEVNGRILSYVNQHVISGNTLTIQTPQIPPIPTFDPGTHVVKFVITNPAKTVPLPSIAYFVAPSDYAGRSIVIKILSPKDKAVIEYAPVKFAWEGFQTDASYSIQFYDSPKAEKTVFSMCVLGSSYTLSGDALKMIFIPNKKYYWKIKGCSADNDYGESQLGEFTFKK